MRFYPALRRQRKRYCRRSGNIDFAISLVFKDVFTAFKVIYSVLEVQAMREVQRTLADNDIEPILGYDPNRM